MSTKDEPLAIKVVCKACNLIQVYRGQIHCIHCGEQGSLQLQNHVKPQQEEHGTVNRRTARTTATAL